MTTKSAALLVTIGDADMHVNTKHCLCVGREGKKRDIQFIWACALSCAGFMPRTLRASQGGYVYHVINRGNARNKVFRKQDEHYLTVLRTVRAT
jgi:hypothetical protein